MNVQTNRNSVPYLRIFLNQVNTSYYSNTHTQTQKISSDLRMHKMYQTIEKDSNDFIIAAPIDSTSWYRRRWLCCYRIDLENHKMTSIDQRKPKHPALIKDIILSSLAEKLHLLHNCDNLKSFRQFFLSIFCCCLKTHTTRILRQLEG